MVSDVVSLLLSVTFACGLFIALAHVINRRFIAPAYDVAANLTAFACATAASMLLGHWIPAALSTGAIGCWLILAERTYRARRPQASRDEVAPPDRPEPRQTDAPSDLSRATSGEVPSAGVGKAVD